jgi:hypothetical protein
MLFKSVTEIKEFLPIGIGNDFNRLKPHIASAENKYIKPLLGTSMYDELQEFYDATYPENPTDVQIAMKELLGKVQLALIHLAYFVGFDFMNIEASDMGFHRVESDSTKGLYGYQENNLRKYFSDSGFNNLDDVLTYIEENIEHFAEFKAETNYTVLKQSFLPTVKAVEEIPFNLHGSRLTFLALKPGVSYIEDTQIKKLLGTTIYNTIKTEMVKDSPAAKVTDIIPYIRKPLIYLASAFLMQETGADLTEKGLYFEKTDPVYRGTLKKQPAEMARVSELVRRNQLIGEGYLEELKSYLVANADDWADYSGQTGRVFNRDNTDKKTFWA